MPLTVAMLVLLLVFVDCSPAIMGLFISGVVLATIGLIFFIVGINISILPLGREVGKTVIVKSNIWLLLLLAVVFGIVITIAEPAVLVFAPQTNLVTDKFVSNFTLVVVMSLGMGFSFSLSLLRYVFQLSLRKILVTTYLIIFTVATMVPPAFYNVAFDAGGVTTGAVVSPFLIAFGVGLTTPKGITKKTEESFGYVALAAVGPILAVLLLGVFS